MSAGVRRCRGDAEPVKDDLRDRSTGAEPDFQVVVIHDLKSDALGRRCPPARSALSQTV